MSVVLIAGRTSAVVGVVGRWGTCWDDSVSVPVALDGTGSGRGSHGFVACLSTFSSPGLHMMVCHLHDMIGGRGKSSRLSASLDTWSECRYCFLQALDGRVIFCSHN